ncbi:unnamed protein product [Arctogadus glacialis]
MSSLNNPVIPLCSPQSSSFKGKVRTGNELAFPIPLISTTASTLSSSTRPITEPSPPAYSLVWLPWSSGFTEERSRAASVIRS